MSVKILFVSISAQRYVNLLLFFFFSIYDRYIYPLSFLFSVSYFTDVCFYTFFGALAVSLVSGFMYSKLRKLFSGKNSFPLLFCDRQRNKSLFVASTNFMLSCTIHFLGYFVYWFYQTFLFYLSVQNRYHEYQQLVSRTLVTIALEDSIIFFFISLNLLFQ